MNREGRLHVWNLRVTKIMFFFLSFGNSVTQPAPHQHLELLFISFGSDSEAIIQKPSCFHPSSSIFEYGAVATTMHIIVHIV